MNSSQSRSSSPDAMPCANCRAISSMAIPATATAVNTPPNTQNSTDDGDKGASAIENMPAMPSAQTSSRGQLRVNALLLIGALLFLAESMVFISIQLLVADSTELDIAAITNIAFSQLFMSIAFLNQPKLAS